MTPEEILKEIQADVDTIERAHRRINGLVEDLHATGDDGFHYGASKIGDGADYIATGLFDMQDGITRS